jgi:hypothetical protein
MLIVLALMVFDAQVSSPSDCAILRAALETATIAQELESGTEVSAWGTPVSPMPFGNDYFEWQCELPTGVRWERQSRERYGGDRRTMVIQLTEPLISGESAWLRLTYSQWEPDAEAGWISEQ